MKEIGTDRHGGIDSDLVLLDGWDSLNGNIHLGYTNYNVYSVKYWVFDPLFCSGVFPKSKLFSKCLVFQH